MNQSQKNIALWIVISLVFVFLFQMFNQPQGQKEEMAYSDFIGYVERGTVAEVTIQGENIEGRLADGKVFKLFAPRDPNLVSLLKEKGVRISARPAEGSSWYMTILISWLPIILLVGVWIFFMR
ncbi:MAG: ATP-dependent metallopeptidase FtsH/Yme1/Tma family protein, partial [Deltaproteobacteria bacterium]|nr:ATP-dependent metallopeptidase FtsH/Yme1/Tma family protein [Deltaproteobacteria bacterium]